MLSPSRYWRLIYHHPIIYVVSIQLPVYCLISFVIFVVIAPPSYRYVHWSLYVNIKTCQFSITCMFSGFHPVTNMFFCLYPVTSTYRLSCLYTATSIYRLSLSVNDTFSVVVPWFRHLCFSVLHMQSIDNWLHSVAFQDAAAQRSFFHAPKVFSWKAIGKHL